MNVLVAHVNKRNPNNWRVPGTNIERTSMEDIFGSIYECDIADDVVKIAKDVKADVMFWHLNAEKTPSELWEKACDARTELWPIQSINDPSNYLAVHLKHNAFTRWESSGVSCPQHYPFKNWEEFDEFAFPFPYLIRVPNGNTGEGSFLVHNPEELEEAFPKLMAVDLSKKYGHSMCDDKICVEYIDHMYKGYRYSFRAIVAGNEVVAGYARVCGKDDWVAITEKFTTEKGEVFIELNKKCQEFCKTHKDDIIKAVHYLGLNWQGIDIIFDDAGNHYFLEVQPDFSCGNCYSGHTGPWYNPSYPELVKFIHDNEDRFKKEVPFYYYNWLNKTTMFNNCHLALRRYFDENPVG